MTTVAVLADPPREGFVLTTLVETTPLSPAEAADLYAASLADVLRAGEASGGDLLVNYRSADTIPDEFDEGKSAEEEIKAVARAALREPQAARYERQVGETVAGRAGNTATHLLEQERVDSVALIAGSATCLTRTEIDGAAMKLRRSEVVLGPSGLGGVYYAGFTEPIDFQGAYATPGVETLTERALDADLGVDFLSVLPTFETPTGLASAVSLLRARGRAGRIVPEHTTACIDDLGLAVAERDGRPELVRE